MKYIANILTKGKFNDIELCNVVSKKEDIIDGIPTLVIGWEFTRFNYPEASIIDWEISDNVFWTFGKKEKRPKYETNICSFKEYAIENLKKSVYYNFFNILTAEKSEKEELFQSLKNCDNCYSYIHNDIVYIYNPCNNNVIGLSLRDIEYEGKSKKVFLSFIYGNNNITQITTNDKLSFDMADSLRNYNYVIPYLFS